MYINESISLLTNGLGPMGYIIITENFNDYYTEFTFNINDSNITTIYSTGSTSGYINLYNNDQISLNYNNYYFNIGTEFITINLWQSGT
ncbi:hypothetical protein EBQ81_04480 [bacterium]|nr:hypothetical protein [bacterium]